MFRSIALLLLLIMFLAGCQSGPALVTPAPSLHACHFMTGLWVSTHSTDDGARVSEEHWLSFQPDGSIGSNRLTINGRTVFFEFLRIETNDDGTFYIAQPKGRSPGVHFAMIEHSDNRVVFENPDHDFPQRIVYERDGNELHASVEGKENDEYRVERWKWQRQRR